MTKILFICAAGASVGGGHVMRSLTLAHALAERGAACAFKTTLEVAKVLDAFAPDMARADSDEGFDAVVFDSYALAADDHRALAKGRPALVIDDLADRPLAADLVLDSGPARRAEDYAGLVAPETRLLLGPAYAPVRPAFAALREDALGRRAGTPPVRRILVSLGLTDVGGITGRVAALLRPIVGDVALDLVVGGGAPSLPTLWALAAEDPRLELHVDTQHMPGLLLEADLAIGAGGSTTWERCVLALPTLTLILANNQVAAARALEAAGVTPCLDVAAPDFDTAFGKAVEGLLADERRRAALSAASTKVCDGLGADRAADAFLALV
ncbi:MULTISPECIES: UDP-2,4-diacetamido-2,4,6-trideoxy-beta-L-altropyranose hydrolase [unclassified Caulobacter]|uniref:UDP-2,4-diacetamido-2,4, 6-trideoxy-beta-L-altropyranose hydrolase n=1 Tax=unclassified Caulobacter TaxID=2648921 RepID=UPI0006F403A7|nr:MULTISPECIES: UDP-2,4-diacetamido-2,4,6-trideoxy-beta-L-altropyranose hydrolase [unclassified Caulobacter]KQV56020.1 UDP-2,4-diacetamido-2,4,6-trideoxy-beta-L-altropyranose hydrolase [Caulobacter sp. Root342]KQV70806.1 UDP-2,4-diacetamido-2,4,6-trideoxy-beta-L-altropyranose hydrolase [Caulobacter sp. Root343]